MAETYRAFKGVYDSDPEYLSGKPFSSPNEPYAGFFSDSPAVASDFATLEGDIEPNLTGSVYPVDLTFKNPLVIDGSDKFSISFQDPSSAREDGVFEQYQQFLKAFGKDSSHDGVIIRNTLDEGTVYVPRSYDQIQSIFNPPSEPRPPDKSKLPAVIDAASVAAEAARFGADESRPKGKGAAFRGLGSLARSPIFKVARLVQEGYNLLPEDYKVIEDWVARMKETQTHELFGMDKPGIEYLKEWLGISPEDLGETIPPPPPGQVAMEAAMSKQKREMAEIFSSPGEDARQKRAREGGFKETLSFKHPDEGMYEIDNLLYHGTDDDVEEFDLNHPRRKDAGWLGTGVYLDSHPGMGSLYARAKTDFYRREGGNVMPVKIRMTNPFFATPRMKEQIEAIERESGREAARKAADELTESLKKLGHDGVLLRRESSFLGGDNNPLGVNYEVVVFDPSDVKSAFSEFDPAYSRSPKLSKAAGGFVDKPLYDDARIGGMI